MCLFPKIFYEKSIFITNFFRYFHKLHSCQNRNLQLNKTKIAIQNLFNVQFQLKYTDKLVSVLFYESLKMIGYYCWNTTDLLR